MKVMLRGVVLDRRLRPLPNGKFEHFVVVQFNGCPVVMPIVLPDKTWHETVKGQMCGVEVEMWPTKFWRASAPQPHNQILQAVVQK